MKVNKHKLNLDKTEFRIAHLNLRKSYKNMHSKIGDIVTQQVTSVRLLGYQVTSAMSHRHYQLSNSYQSISTKPRDIC